MPTQTRMDEFADWGTEVVFGRAHGFRAFMMRCLLRFASLLFFVLVKVRLFLFRRRIKTVRNLGTLVISVGNITAGGTGKTPVVELLSRTLAQRGRTVSILTRGYKSAELDTPQMWKDANGHPVDNLPKIASDGTTRYLGPLHAGDEPFMLARNLDGVSVLVDKDRVKSGIFAIEQLGADTLILDDGMQYLKLAHELDIVLVDCGAPFGTGALLPRGTMREPRSSLKRADYIILTKSDGAPQDELIRRIRRYNKSADIIVTNHGPKYFENVFTGERKPLDFVHDKWVACMSGIARPENFENAVEQLGGKVEIRRRYPDHYWFDQNDLEAFVERCADRAMDLIVTTEKDAVRFLKPGEMDVPIYFLRIEIDILEGREHWDCMIERIIGLNRPQPAPQWSQVL
ncbi:tetraacyldisaccharide 4'-kinase [Akkermansia glycaniphila]|uniref:Tetraacyldisaccharide 4'-kinase n=1 Tax=Akkermansia glycaniphila TaxID=1679444 RepID=A0A1C7P9C4_9BACT|nr:tetraacyldisaccharide 4'-kinase [Akkermansia glycaniphila]MBT9450361.1 tetraacyldisaccharide 4'-kinase [Akkermansia glycaniphila]OCA02088.1 tetraacyldisaccharide 4'-kinase [Akkermansia glycaniphila]SEH94054.1 tetraacyldisaccharide-1-p 4'-kinase [Akkermansia glycaniphila]